jgi:hypothetical protein
LKKLLSGFIVATTTITLALSIASLTQPWYYLKQSQDGGSTVYTTVFHWTQATYTAETTTGDFVNSSTSISYNDTTLLAATMGIILAFLTLGTTICLDLILVQSCMLYVGKTSKAFMVFALADSAIYMVAFFMLFNITNALQ